MMFDAPRQSLERAGQLADLVAFARASEPSAQAAAAIEDRARLAPQLTQRTDDRGADHHRQHDRKGQRHDEDLEHGQADRVQVLADLVGRTRDDHRADRVAAAKDRRGRVEHDLLVAAGRHALLDRGHAQERFVDFGAAEDRRALVFVARRQRPRQSSHRVERLLQQRRADAIEPVVPGALDFVVGLQRTGVDHDAPGRIDDAQSPVARPPLAKERRGVVQCRIRSAAAHRRHDDVRLPLHRLDLGVLARLLVRDEQQHAGDRQKDEQHVEEHQPQRDARGDARHAPHHFAPDSG